MMEQQFSFTFNPDAEVTRRKIGPCQPILSVFVNLIYILLAKPHAAMHVCVLCIPEGQILVTFY